MSSSDTTAAGAPVSAARSADAAQRGCLTALMAVCRDIHAAAGALRAPVRRNVGGRGWPDPRLFSGAAHCLPPLAGAQ